MGPLHVVNLGNTLQNAVLVFFYVMLVYTIQHIYWKAMGRKAQAAFSVSVSNNHQRVILLANDTIRNV